MKKLQLLDSLKGLPEKIRNNTVNEKYWKEELKFIEEKAKEQENVQKMIEMNTIKFQTPFTI